MTTKTSYTFDPLSGRFAALTDDEVQDLDAEDESDAVKLHINEELQTSQSPVFDLYLQRRSGARTYQYILSFCFNAEQTHVYLANELSVAELLLRYAPILQTLPFPSE